MWPHDITMFRWRWLEMRLGEKSGTESFKLLCNWLRTVPHTSLTHDWNMLSVFYWSKWHTLHPTCLLIACIMFGLNIMAACRLRVACPITHHPVCLHLFRDTWRSNEKSLWVFFISWLIITPLCEVVWLPVAEYYIVCSLASLIFIHVCVCVQGDSYF